MLSFQLVEQVHSRFTVFFFLLAKQLKDIVSPSSCGELIVLFGKIFARKVFLFLQAPQHLCFYTFVFVCNAFGCFKVSAFMFL